MKASQTGISDIAIHRIEAELARQIKELFGRCPELAGFAIQDLAGLAYDEEEDVADKRRLFVTDVGFSATVSLEEIDKVHSLIGRAISDVLAERPEAFDLLRGRTFARTLH